jgi:glycosyltransferase involved in cell wall biosynthesis
LTGVGRYVRELGAALEQSGTELDRYAVAWGGHPPAGVQRTRIPARLAQWSWRRLGRPIPKAFARADVVHATNFVLPPTGKIPSVVTIHDLSFLRADVFPGGERLRDLVPWSLGHARRAIVPSEAIAMEIEERLGWPRDKTTVTYEGVADVFFGATPLADSALGRFGIPGPFAICVGTVEPRKNLARLIRAWTAARTRLDGWSLVIAGPKGWGPDLPETEGVIPIGRVGDETLPGLLAAAELFVYPSLYEGFGLPPLEAMAAGTASIVGDYGPAREVLGDAAVIVDPLDPEALAAALGDLGEDASRRRLLGLTGRARAGEFTWARTATATIQAYEAATEGGTT